MFKIISDEFSKKSLNDLLRDLNVNRLICSSHSEVKGDKRYWDVSKDNYEIVSGFSILASKLFELEVGVPPKNLVIMINRITAQDSPDGSGGGWHVDSVRNQYKLFMYLTDCENQNFGPLTLFTSGNRFLDKIVIAVNYMLGNKFRFSEYFIRLLSKLGFKEKPVLLPKNKPFWVNTSYIHRGAEITEGERVMMTAYIYKGAIPLSIQGRINGV